MPTEQGSVYLAAPDTPIPATVDTPSDWKPLHDGGAGTDFYVDDEHPRHIWLNAHEPGDTTEANADLLGSEGPFAILVVQAGNHQLYYPSVWKDTKEPPPGSTPENVPPYWTKMYATATVQRH